MGIGRTLRRVVLAAAVALGAAGLAWDKVPAQEAPDESGGTALLAAIEGPIGPGMSRHVEKVLDTAREEDAELLILRLNTPGGLATSMRDVISEILGSDVPVVGFVAPPGAHAASAGTYILYATHLAAMAPGTNLGSATPVQIGGGGLPGMPGGDQQDGEEGDQAEEEEEQAAPGDPMTAKAVNDAVAFIRGLAEMHGRNAEWAERAVREAANLPAREALELNVINVVAEDAEELLRAIDGRSVNMRGAERTLSTQGLSIVPLEPDFLTRILSLLSNPNFALILLMIGVYGLIFEFANPGGIGPGIIGAICLVLGLYALNQLPIDYAGLALIVLGIGLMVAEAITPAFGVLGGGGLAAFVIGAMLLIDTDVPAFQLSWWTIGGVAAFSGLFLVLIVGYVWRVYRRPGKRMRNEMIGAEGTVLDWSGGQGHVFASGERWAARGEQSLAEGQPVRVRALDGLTLVVGEDRSAKDAGGGDVAARPEPHDKGE